LDGFEFGKRQKFDSFKCEKSPKDTFVGQKTDSFCKNYSINNEIE